MENKIYNCLSLFIIVYPSPFVYKLTIYIYIYMFSYLEPALPNPHTASMNPHTAPAHCKHAMQSCNRSSHPILKQHSIFLVHI